MLVNSENNIIYKINPNLAGKKCKIAFFDLDHTLIKPLQGRVHSRSNVDVTLWNPIVPDKLMELYQKKYKLVLVTNQKDILNQDNKKKMDIWNGKIEFMKKHLFLEKFSILAATNNDYCRKPNLGLFHFLEEKTKLKLDLTESIMVGDAAGRIKTTDYKADFACTDRMWAANLGIKFYTPEEFFLGEDSRKFVMPKLSHQLFPGSHNDKKMLEKKKTQIKKFQIIMLFGPPASGKSMLAGELEKLGYHIINQDSLKTKAKCLKKMKDLLDLNIESKIVLDNTNGKISYRKSFTDILNSKKLKYCLVNLDMSKEQCFFLDNYRAKLEKKKRLADVAIHSYFKYREIPTLEEGFDKIININFLPEFNNFQELDLFNQYY